MIFATEMPTFHWSFLRIIRDESFGLTPENSTYQLYNAFNIDY